MPPEKVDKLNPKFLSKLMTFRRAMRELEEVKNDARSH